MLSTTDGESGAALSARFPTLLEPDPRIPYDPESLLIVRPDGYVGLAADRGAWEEVERYLAPLAPV